ncbi:uncharacterized protein CEXT_174571 [Caerostris extrusa]|uniref:PID domain-containing protein n=1 Tax=Caerostris extrusa TaxID=172846 RepID=A0AAV4WNZ7_CAEEX|nr:uncharacterized protein CEXT_174571 [Caerostris extrusa]
MSLDSDLNAGFQVKYLGSISFTRKKRQPLKGIVSLQRPLLDLYTEARRRGENHRSIHPLALTQHLEICDYGLVVAEGTNRGETVITKVITPLSNVILWAAVRFHARIIKKRVFGAAFVPLACSDGVLDHKSYICLASKQRFLVSLTHPSVFACIYRSVSSPTTFECHAFVCATAEDALAVAGLATLASQQNDLPSVRRSLYLDPPPPRRRIAASVDSGTDYYTPSDVTPAPREEEDRAYCPPFRENGIPRTDTEEESNSYASVINKASSPSVGRRRYVLGGRSQYRSRPRKRFMNHREARALIGRCGVPGRPLPEDEELWRTTLTQRRDPDLLEGSQRSTPGYDQRSEPDQAPSEIATTPDPRYRNISTMTECGTKETDVKEEEYLPPPTEVLVETIDLSSESASSANSSASSAAGWRPLLPADAPTDDPPLVKYTYFGYETYARPTDDTRKVSGANGSSELSVAKPSSLDDRTSASKRMVEQRRPKNRKAHHKSGESHKEGIIKGNGTGKVTINVPYNNNLRPDSRNSSASSRTVPHGVRSFHKNGHVRNWSSLSQTSASSSSSYRGMTTLPTSSSHARSPSHKGVQHHPQKVIRWSSEDRLPRRQSGGFFLSLKRLSIQSLTKAKHKTGKFISSMKTRIMGTKRSSADGSEDSAYDTSEVCLSPSGRQGSSSPSRQPAQRNAARRQQSWSFHDLRSAAVEKPVVRRSHNVHHRRKHRRRSRKTGQSSSSSDSGVEAAYHSDNSGRKSVSDPGRLANGAGVTRVQVQHGMGTGTFQRWSNTNIQDELGYIP